MAYTNEHLNNIYDRTNGKCHLCHKKLAFTNYARPGARGAWEVEHSRPRACGGTNRRCNLYPACISCNRAKRAGSARSARSRNGTTRAPLNRERRAAARFGNAAAGAGIGALAGRALLGPGGGWVGGVFGAAIGHDRDPDR